MFRIQTCSLLYVLKQNTCDIQSFDIHPHQSSALNDHFKYNNTFSCSLFFLLQSSGSMWKEIQALNCSNNELQKPTMMHINNEIALKTPLLPVNFTRSPSQLPTLHCWTTCQGRRDRWDLCYNDLASTGLWFSKTIKLGWWIQPSYAGPNGPAEQSNQARNQSNNQVKNKSALWS